MHGAKAGPSGSVGGAAREERKLVTVLAAELRTGSPSRSSTSEAGGSLRRALAAIGVEIVEGWGGVHSPVADGFLAVFGLAAAGEADVVHALHTALGLVRELGPAVGIGVDTGVIVAPNPPPSDLQCIGGEAIEIAGRLREGPAPAPRSSASGAGARPRPVPLRPCHQRGRDGEIGVVAREVRSVEPSAPIRPWPNVPMVGRSAELNALVAFADEVAVGGGRVSSTWSAASASGSPASSRRPCSPSVSTVPTSRSSRGRCLSVGGADQGHARGHPPPGVQHQSR